MCIGADETVLKTSEENKKPNNKKKHERSEKCNLYREKLIALQRLGRIHSSALGNCTFENEKKEEDIFRKMKNEDVDVYRPGQKL